MAGVGAAKDGESMSETLLPKGWYGKQIFVYLAGQVPMSEPVEVTLVDTSAAGITIEVEVGGTKVFYPWYRIDVLEGP